jgi:hypothetical protein
LCRIMHVFVELERPLILGSPKYLNFLKCLTLTMLDFMDSVVPTGLTVLGNHFPAMNHWANIISPYGTWGFYGISGFTFSIVELG